MRNDNDNHKYANWRVNYLYSTYLFGKNFGIMANIEQIFVSMVAICQTATDPARIRNEKEDVHKDKMLSLFSSVIDFYDVLFKSLGRGLSAHLAHKKPTAENVKTYLRMVKLWTFFEQSGKRTLVSAGKRKDELNFKFFKMLLNRSAEFVQFVKLVHSRETDEHLDVPEFQVISILLQLHAEAKERLEKQQAGTELSEATGEAVDRQTAPQLESEQRSVRKQSSTWQRPTADNDVVLYAADADDDDELPPRVVARRPGAEDAKTQAYLQLVRGMQYEDEYDDTHDVGDGFRRKAKPARRAQRAKSDSSADSDDDDRRPGKEAAFPVDDDNEDSGEDIDVMNKWERKHSNFNPDDDVDEILERGAPRGRGGARARGGQGPRGGYNQYDKRGGRDEGKHRTGDNFRDNQASSNRRHDDNKRAQGDRDHGRHRDDNDNFRPKRNDHGDYRDDYRQSDRRDDDYRRNDGRSDYRGDNYGRGDRQNTGQFKPKQGNRDTR